MRNVLFLIGAIAAVLAALWLIPPDPVDPTSLEDLDLPWQVEPGPDGNSQVLGVHLGTATLADAIARFGEPQGIALFLKEGGERSLESYFGTVRFGPFEAKIVATLAADAGLVDALAANAVGRDRTRSGDIKLLLADADKPPLVALPLKAISYIPNYGGMDADFFRTRLGEPAAWRQENQEAVSWFYPRLGLTLLIDPQGKEIFEYVPPRAFQIPADAETTAR